jgi:hypothetical protein
MAHSIQDIPPGLRNREEKQHFIVWLSETPIMNSVKRSLIAAWRRSNGDNSFTPDDYRTALQPPPGSDYIRG